MSCRRTYIPSTWSAVCVFSPLRMAERMASVHESAVRMIAPFLVKMATLSLAPVEPLELSNPLSEIRRYSPRISSRSSHDFQSEQSSGG